MLANSVANENVREVPKLIFDYVTKIFSCRDCGKHFQAEEKRFQISKIKSSDDAVLWLWKIHNIVNERLRGAPAEDPEFPKIQFPEPWLCGDCSEIHGKTKRLVFDDDKVAAFLKEFYSAENLSDEIIQPEKMSLSEEEKMKMNILFSHHKDL